MSQLRSISFPPSRVHPNAARVQEALTKLKQDCSSGHVSSTLFGLDELYVCLDDLLNLQSTQQSLSHETSRQAVDHILDGSVKILDICGISRDLVAEIKERVRNLLSSIRRRKGDSSSAVADYAKFRKKVKKDAKRMTSALMKQQILADIDQDSEPQVVSVLREVNLSSCHVLKSLLMFLSGSSASLTKTRRQSKWSRVSRFVHKAAAVVVDCEEKDEEGDDVNELATVDSWLTKLLRRCKNEGSDNIVEEKTHQTVQKQLEALEMSIESIENGLDCIFRRLIKSRASLLNIISQ